MLFINGEVADLEGAPFVTERLEAQRGIKTPSRFLPCRHAQLDLLQATVA